MRASLGWSEGRGTKGATRWLFPIWTLDQRCRDIIPGAGVALHLGEDDLPSPGILSTADAGFPGNGPPWGGRGERRVWGPGVGTRRKWGGWSAATCARSRMPNARLRVQRVHVVGVRRFHSNFGESRFWRQRRCDQSETGDGNKLCKSPSGDGSDDSDSLKTYLAGSSQCDSGEPLLPGLATPARADLVLVQVPSNSLHRLAAQFSQVFIFHFFHL